MLNKEGRLGFVTRTLTRDVQSWLSEPVPSSYFFNVLTPYIRFKEICSDSNSILFCMVDKMRKYDFSACYHREKRGYKFKTGCEEMECVKEIITKEPKRLKALLSKVINIYKKEKYQSKYERITLNEVKTRCGDDYKLTWENYLNESKFNYKRNELDQLATAKNRLTKLLVQYFKEERSPYVFVRPVNSFFWQIEILSDYFREELRKELPHHVAFVESLEKSGGTIQFELRFKSEFPQKLPFIRIVQPVMKENPFVSKGGVLHKVTTFKPIKSKEVRGIEEYLRTLKNLLLRNKLTVECGSREEEEVGVYEESVASVDYKRKMLVRVKRFQTVNSYSERMSIYSPIFHFQDNIGKQESMERGNKILLPALSASRIFNYNPNIHLPIFFEITSFKKRSVKDMTKKQEVKSRVICAVCEFSASPKQMIAPRWMVQSLNVNDGEQVNIRCIKLLPCTYVKVQPEDPGFFRDVKNYKTLLESELKHYLTLTVGDTLPLRYGQRTYKIFILELRPEDSVSTVANRDGFLELKMDVVPPTNFDPNLHSKPLDLTGGNLMNMRRLSEIEDEVKSPVRVAGEVYVKCENCHKSVVEYRLFQHVRYCKQNFFCCEDCGKVVKISDKETHKEEFHSSVSCNLCGTSVAKNLLLAHEKNDCPERMVQCKHLGCPIPAKERWEHEQSCGAKTELCKKCGKYVLIKDVGIHADSGCIYGETTADRKNKDWKSPSHYNVSRRSPVTPSLQKHVTDEVFQLNMAIEKSLKEKEGGKNGERPLSDYEIQMNKAIAESLKSSSGDENSTTTTEEEEKELEVAVPSVEKKESYDVPSVDEKKEAMMDVERRMLEMALKDSLKDEKMKEKEEEEEGDKPAETPETSDQQSSTSDEFNIAELRRKNKERTEKMQKMKDQLEEEVAMKDLEKRFLQQAINDSLMEEQGEEPGESEVLSEFKKSQELILNQIKRRAERKKKVEEMVIPTTNTTTTTTTTTRQPRFPKPAFDGMSDVERMMLEQVMKDSLKTEEERKEKMEEDSTLGPFPDTPVKEGEELYVPEFPQEKFVFSPISKEDPFEEKRFDDDDKGDFIS